MALQILPYDLTSPAAFGTGIGQGLQVLAQKQLEQLHSLRGLQSLGFSPEESRSLSGLDPLIQREIIKQKLVAPQQEAYAQALQSILGGNSFAPQQMAQQSIPQEGEAIPQEGMEPSAEKTSQEFVSERMPLSFLRPGLNQQQVTELAKLALKKEQASKDDLAERYKATQPYRKEVLDAARAARSDLRDLNRLEELDKEGKLSSPGYVEFLHRSGLDIPALMNPGSEEFQKIANNFLKNAKQYFGARVSNYEIEQFLKTIPSLSQSPEGRKRVVANLKNISRASLEYNDALKEVIAENGGIPPFDLQEKVDDKVEKKMDKLGELFKKDLERPVPKGQNKLITALQAGAGSLVGIPGAVLGKAGRALGALAEL